MTIVTLFVETGKMAEATSCLATKSTEKNPGGVFRKTRKR